MQYNEVRPRSPGRAIVAIYCHREAPWPVTCTPTKSCEYACVSLNTTPFLKSAPPPPSIVHKHFRILYTSINVLCPYQLHATTVNKGFISELVLYTIHTPKCKVVYNLKLSYTRDYLQLFYNQFITEIKHNSTISNIQTFNSQHRILAYHRASSQHRILAYHRASSQHRILAYHRVSSYKDTSSTKMETGINQKGHNRRPTSNTKKQAVENQLESH